MLAHTAAYEIRRPVSRKKVSRICKILGINGPKSAKKHAIKAAKAKWPQFFPTAPHRLPEADIAHVRCGADGRCHCFNVVDIFSRKRLSRVFFPEAMSESAVRSVLAAVEGPSPRQIREIRQTLAILIGILGRIVVCIPPLLSTSKSPAQEDIILSPGRLDDIAR